MAENTNDATLIQKKIDFFTKQSEVLRNNRKATTDTRHQDRIDNLLARNEQWIKTWNKELTTAQAQEFMVDTPEYLTKLSTSGMPSDVLRSMYMQQAIPYSNKYNSNIRQAGTQYAQTGLSEDFHNSAI